MTKDFKIKKIQLKKSTDSTPADKQGDTRSDLEKLKAKLAGVKAPKTEKGKTEKESTQGKEALKEPAKKSADEEKPRRIRAKSRSAFEPLSESEEEHPESIEAQEHPSLEAPIEEDSSTHAEVKGSVETSLIEPSPLPQPMEAPPVAAALGKAPSAPPVTSTPTKAAGTPQPAPKEPTPAPSTTGTPPAEVEEDDAALKKKKLREFRDIKPKNDRAKGAVSDDEDRWRKKRKTSRYAPQVEEISSRPTQITIRLPISIKDLAEKMKRKTSELIQKLFLQGFSLTLNDLLDDETLIQFIGTELNCEIRIDRSLVDKIKVVKENVRQEIANTTESELILRPPVVTFMGHVDHGKTSLIDAIRKSNVAASEAGAITQHIGAFRCKTAVGDITILDTPGHEAFSSMRARGAQVTDIVVLVVAGDEGLREQTLEAIELAKTAGVTIMVALNKCDKPNFNPELVYRQLSEVDLLPEAWGGQTITVNTSATTGAGLSQLLEMLALQAEILELKANPNVRARGLVLESELHKGLGAVATVLVQNGTLRIGDAIVLDHLWGRVKTMQDERGLRVEEAKPSTPIEITGLSGLPKAGDSFVVVKTEKEAREIAEMRAQGLRDQTLMQKKAPLLDNLRAESEKRDRKVFNVVLRADVQGSLEALKNSLAKIKSKKIDLEIVYGGIGEITESDVELAAASNAVVIGFHTHLESMAALLAKERAVTIRLHDIIYHAIDEIKELMRGRLDKIEEEKELGRAEVKALFKVSGLGTVAGCLVTDGVISRNARMRAERAGQALWRGTIGSLKRIKEDVKEVKKGLECGILLNGFSDLQPGDQLVACEIIYHIPELE